MENLAGLVAAYGYYDRKIVEVECDTPSSYVVRTGAPISDKEFDAMRCEVLNDLERRKETVAKAIDRLVDRLGGEAETWRKLKKNEA